MLPGRRLIQMLNTTFDNNSGAWRTIPNLISAYTSPSSPKFGGIGQ